MRKYLITAALFSLLCPDTTYAQVCTQPKTCGAGQASKWNGNAWVCVSTTTTFYVPAANGAYGVVNAVTGGYSCPPGTSDQTVATLWYGKYGYSSLHSCNPQ